MLDKLISELNEFADENKAELFKKFFKTRKGEYGEGDIFIGVAIPEQRKIAKKYSQLPFPKIKMLLDSKIHEHRMIAGIILTEKYKEFPAEVFNFYLKNSKKFNNWDLVDVTCIHILGNFLLNKDKKILYEFAKSKNLWEKRIAIVSTFEFIKNNQLGDTLTISEILLEDEHDLIHKAVGWMLREVGKKDKKVLEDFLKSKYKKLSRTTLRYAIERFPEDERKKWLKNIK